jgi:hypothetical protein
MGHDVPGPDEYGVLSHCWPVVQYGGAGLPDGLGTGAELAGAVDEAAAVDEGAVADGVAAAEAVRADFISSTGAAGRTDGELA